MVRTTFRISIINEDGESTEESVLGTVRLSLSDLKHNRKNFLHALFILEHALDVLINPDILMDSYILTQERETGE